MNRHRLDVGMGLLGSEGYQDLQPSSMALWHMDYFEQKALKNS